MILIAILLQINIPVIATRYKPLDLHVINQTTKTQSNIIVNICNTYCGE